tara:strand:- start:6050 stop:6730 length:681 start_codon:yes stop_codon:yes gene_type:complete
MKKKVDFDNYSDEYNQIMQEQHKIFGDVNYYSEYKAEIVKNIISDNNNLKILEFGCGVGRNLKYLKSIGNNNQIYGYDISEESLIIARKENPEVTIVGTEKELLSHMEFFDLIFIAGVYHHIEVILRDTITKNLRTLLKSNGKLVIFEHNPYNPITRHLVNTCEFDADAVLLKKQEVIDLFCKKNFSVDTSGYALFIPPRLQKINFIEKYFKWLPLGGQYYVLFNK